MYWALFWQLFCKCIPEKEKETASMVAVVHLPNSVSVGLSPSVRQCRLQSKPVRRSDFCTRHAQLPMPKHQGLTASHGKSHSTIPDSCVDAFLSHSFFFLHRPGYN